MVSRSARSLDDVTFDGGCGHFEAEFATKPFLADRGQAFIRTGSGHAKSITVVWKRLGYAHQIQNQLRKPREAG